MTKIILLAIGGKPVINISLKEGNRCKSNLCHPIQVVEHGNYIVIVVTLSSRIRHPMISMLFIP